VTWAERLFALGDHDVRVLDARGPASGPTVVIVAGVHGDESEPVAAVVDLLGNPPPLVSGRLRIVPIANPAAWAAGTRCSPADGKDLARCFPGVSNGTFTERLAHLISSQALEDADLLLDLHSAGLHYGMPLLAGCLDDGSPAAERSAAAARAMGPPLLWLHERYGPGRTVSAMAARGRAAIYAESGGGPTMNTAHVGAYGEAIRRLLTHLGMTSAAAAPRPALRVVRGGGDLDNDVIRSSLSGLFVPSARPGDLLEPNARIGAMLNLHGGVTHVAAPSRPAVLMLLRRTANVRAGDVLAAFATEEDQ
jgi:predicted deacylase